MPETCILPLEHANAYKPRSPRKNVYYRCVEDHFEQLENAWEDHYQQKFGYWRSFVMKIIYKYLECGDLRFGFARVRCDTCHHEYLLAFSCKGRHFCPSCHQKRVVEFGEWLYTEVLKKVPHRQWVFSIPKRLRIYFMYDRKLLAKLSLCAWRVLSSYLKQGVPLDDAEPGAVIAVQTFGDFLNFNPHLHIMAPDGGFYGEDSFIVGPEPDPKDLEDAFRFEVFKMLKAEGKINDAVIENMLGWYNSGFNVYCSNPIGPTYHEGIERLAQYIIRAPISQERMKYVPAEESADGVARVIYQAKDGHSSRTFLALDWLAQLITHIPNKGEQTVRYYGYYSNKSRGMRKKAGTDDKVPALIESETSGKEFRKNWARLIQKVYNTNPLICPKCDSGMRIIAFVEEATVIKKILLHLNLWDTHNHDPPPDKIITGYVPEVQEERIKLAADNHTQVLYDNDGDYYEDPPFYDEGSQVTYEDDYSQLTHYED